MQTKISELERGTEELKADHDGKEKVYEELRSQNKHLTSDAYKEEL